jgi:predicted DNA-binding antitoxin AbrB/MazE fold protein
MSQQVYSNVPRAWDTNKKGSKMGYRSDVALMAVFSSEEHFEEVMAVYRMDANVQTYDLEKAWRKVVLRDGEIVLIYQGNDVKWYESYEDVQGFEHMATLLEEFWEQRQYSYAWANYRIGEEDTDISCDLTSSDDDLGNDLREIIYDGLGIHRSIEVGL